jgi:hypothetical protein
MRRLGKAVKPKKSRTTDGHAFTQVNNGVHEFRATPIGRTHPFGISTCRGVFPYGFVPLKDLAPHPL